MEEKKSAGDDKSSSSSSSTPVIDFSDSSEVEASHASASVMHSIERRLRIVVLVVAKAYALQTLQGHFVIPSAVLYGCVVCAYDVKLSAMLSVLRVVQLPTLAESVGTKSGSKRIFAAANVNVSPSIHDLFDTSLQIWQSPQSRRVMMKLDDEVMG
ncbi:uncharacterized protein MONOS_10944 [Monocercomonoides exilis]|uniref:uncharacterized protein n=1 Tax=Monocercomonoides exilis TaxID=2049356 RepID=UPI00355A1EEC|nr:hypothetical protein MONOS_10944 [Monocercomonoides exilis]|eukprot:MONOS_10944.1-p1 / transcript=MONOS_10944.1 / gene=MONOS_10944 / organism=Monocercomonoides_exilis_PA203 / gene_product=unspecified product / transcript_product=unspecified product / location=Mono_scaffold00520:32846-33313(-) / protein_length=156 / sequence_SO=supercontig / SO=protein_coding / is_pseudo=false